MQIGIVGLGRMGGNISLRLHRAGHDCVVFDRDPDAVAKARENGANATGGLRELVERLAAPRAVWVMLPAGEITQMAIAELAALLAPGDTVIDGGNTYFKDDIRRAASLRERGLHYVDVGTSGGVFGLDRGYCMMIGGPDDIVERLDPIFVALAPGLGEVPRTAERQGRGGTAEAGYLHCGPAGAGHFVKMIHNGIEYGMMQAYAEGFDILRTRTLASLPQVERFDFNLADIAEVWRRGSVVSSWLLDLTASALAENETLSEFSGQVADSGEGRWTIEAAIEQAVPVPVLTASLFVRFRSRSGNSFGEKLLSAMRNRFGGHMESHGQ